MKGIILILLMVPFMKSSAQYNHIKNNGFDVLSDPNKRYWPLPWGSCDGDVDDCVDWKTRTIKYQSTCGTLCGSTTVLEHSPDLRGKNCVGQNTTPFKGDYCIGVGAFNQELFQQKIKKELIPGRYVFNGFIKRLGYRSTNTILSVYLNDDYLEYDCENDCNALKNGDDCYYELDSDPEYTHDYFFDNECKSRNGNINWHSFNTEFLVTKENLNTLSLVYEGEQKRQKLTCTGANDYVYFDELFLQRKSCTCLDELWIENRTFKDKEEIQASKSVRLGNNVDNVTANGDVVFDGKDIIVRSGQSISIEPGVVIKSGASVRYLIENCKTKFPGTVPSVLYLSNAALQNATDPTNRNWLLVGQNATDYYIQIFNRWGELVSSQADQFNDDNTATIYPPYSLPQGLYTYQLWVYNCDNTSEIKKGSLNMLKSSGSIDIPSNPITIYPNPIKSDLNIKFNNLDDEDIIDIEILNLSGSILLRKKFQVNISAKSNYLESLNVENLNKGIYLINIYKNDLKYFNDKFVKVE